jgi:hypothetical protein
MFALRASSGETPSWITRSNPLAQVLLDVPAQISPEEAGRLGVEGLDTEIRDLSPGFVERSVKAFGQAQAVLKQRLGTLRMGASIRTCRFSSRARSSSSSADASRIGT